ncbi:hypothetical protein [Massilia sp. BJB1822]|uniref:hypothetical protein n=1 Tax=Massilia sp. BJB1822 TaxID=2744470 RepID=UPI0015942B10|nr:hypothetical protein [Massilia sp. BJB1822]NVE01273.1 hypothetical protein [Massilia sp. BJB1822]
MSDDMEFLSLCMTRLGADWASIASQLDQAGYGLPSRIWRESEESFARSEMELASLKKYRDEYAKERLSALRGPLNMLTGKLPEHTTYRSEFLEVLRENKRKGLLKTEGGFESHQIEPCIKRRLETKAIDAATFVNDIRETRRRQISLMGLGEGSDYPPFEEVPDFDFLVTLYANALGGEFSYATVPGGAVFSAHLLENKWNFALWDESESNLKHALLDVSFIVFDSKVSPSGVVRKRNYIAKFSPEDLIQRYHGTRNFSKGSLPDLLYSVNATAVLTKIVFSRLREIILGELAGRSLT